MSTIFRTTVLIISGLAIVFSIPNVILYTKLRSGTISSGTATVMLVLNILLLLLALILFFWALVTVITKPKRQTTFMSPTRAYYSPTQAPTRLYQRY